MPSGLYFDVPTNDPDINRFTDDIRAPSPSPPRRKKSGHRGEAGFGSSVINLANTILGIPPLPQVALTL